MDCIALARCTHTPLPHRPTHRARRQNGTSRVERWRGGLGSGMSVYPGFPVVAQNRMPCPGSTSRSSNRTCGFPASGSPTGFDRRSTARPVGRTFTAALARSAAPESLAGGDRQHGHSPDSGCFRSTPEVRPLPSTGITRLQRYYEPVRHPTRPGLSLAGVRLGVTPSRRWGFPCCVDLPYAHMPSPLPRWQRGWG